MKGKKQCKHCNKFFHSKGLHNHESKCTAIVEPIPVLQRVIDVSDHQVESIVDGVWETFDLGQKVDALATHFHLRTGA